MDERRWKEIEAVYLRALEASDRAAFLTEACHGDAALRAAVERLLQPGPSTTSVFGPLAVSAVDVGRRDSSRDFFQPGTEIGRYRVEALLGSGGSSDVYKALDPRLNRHVALKIFARRRVTAEFRARFERESRAAASLNHPNIATVYEVGETDAPWFIAMEFVDGRTLRAAFADPACPVSDRLGYLVQAAGALARAHASGIAHCDLKPDNVMVTRDGLVKVLDFGLARGEGSAGEPAPVEGTIGYMSPEQIAGLSIGARSDVFSFGCLLFEAVTAQLPFSAPTTTAWLENVLSAPPSTLATHSTPAPAGLQELIDDCLVKDPGARDVSMEEVHRRLEQIVRPRSRRSVVAASVTLLVALAGAAAWDWFREPAPASIAVIPFASSPASPAATRVAEDLSDGVMEALLQLPDLRVIARSSSSRFGGTAFDPQSAAQSLGVRTLLTGRIENTNGQLRITAELIDGADGTAMWAAEYRPTPAGVPDLQPRIAREVARRIQAELTPADERRLDRAIHPNDDVYALLLRGRYEASLYTPDSTARAASYFEQALGIDPSYSLASAELAATYRRMGLLGKLPSDEALRRAEQAALRAIALDDELPDAHVGLARIRQDRWQWSDAEREYRRAIALRPSDASARGSLAILLSLTGRDEEAMAEVMRARALDPVGLPGAVGETAVFYNVRQYDRAFGVLDEALRLDNVAPALWTWTGIVAGGSGDFARAVAAFERAMALGDSNPATRCYYAHALARLGRRDEALAQVAIAERDRALVPRSAFAMAYLGLGDRERAMRELRTGYDTRDAQLQFIRVESYLTGLMTDPRFLQIVARMGLPPPRSP